MIPFCVHLADSGPLMPAAWSAPAAVIVVGLLLAYWRCLRPRGVPRSRRRIRRANTIVQITLTVMLAYALSGIDGHARPGPFTVAWIGVILLVILTIALAMLDVFNTMRLHRRTQSRLRREALGGLGEATRPQRDEPAGGTRSRPLP